MCVQPASNDMNSCYVQKYNLWKEKKEKEKRRKITPLGVITGASRPRGSPKLTYGNNNANPAACEQAAPYKHRHALQPVSNDGKETVTAILFADTRKRQSVSGCTRSLLQHT